MTIAKTNNPCAVNASAEDAAEFQKQFDTYFTERSIKIDKLFQYVMLLQWVGGICVTQLVAPYTWIGAHAKVHEHVWLAVFGGGVLASLPIYLIRTQPGHYSTRMVISASQTLFSCMLIHLTGGRIETHFHIFGSLAFLAMYSDWRVLVPATLVVGVDHIARGVLWPESVFGLSTVSIWRCGEHIGWVMFENTFLVLMGQQNILEMRQKARNMIALEANIAENSRLSLFAMHSSHSCIISDPQGRAQWTNHVFTKMTGYEPEEIIGRRPGQLLQGPRTDPATCAHIAKQIKARKPVKVDILNYNKSGKSYWSSLAINPVFNEAGELIHFIATQTEITEQIEHKQQLVQARKDAESANLSKSQFLANMSHEIRTPLNGMLGFADLLIRTPHIDPETRSEYLETIHKSGQHLLSLINDILDLSKIEAGQMQVAIAPCCPHSVLMDVAKISRANVESKDLYLNVKWNSPIPESVNTDQLRLKQLLMNLISNAVKFTQYGGVDVIASFVRNGDRGLLSFDVRDTGIGIAKDKLETIFKPFTQADSTVTRQFGGTGLGLAISRSIANILGGRLSVRSMPGRGSTFTVEIKIDDACKVKLLDKPPAGVDSKANKEDYSFNGALVLIVDDGETNRRLVQCLLEEADATVECAVNGADALRVASQHDFDLVLMDIQMPVMDGYSATKELIERGYKMPIVALTANAMRGDFERCMQAGFSGFVAKPINRTELMDTIGKQLKKYRQSQTDTSSGCSTSSGSAERQGSDAAAKDDAKASKPAAQSTSTAIVEAEPPASGRMHTQPYRSTLLAEYPQLRSTVVNFTEKFSEQLEMIGEAIENEDWGLVANAAHMLKGSGGSVGFDCITCPATEMENAAKRLDTDSVEQLLDELQTIRSLLVVDDD